MSSPLQQTSVLQNEMSAVDQKRTLAMRVAHVRFGSKADICDATCHVCFTPNSDRKSRHAAMVMSALPLKADSCSATAYVCFGPKSGHRANLRRIQRRAAG